MSESLDLESIRARVRGASPEPWSNYSHSHLVKGCRCLSCHGDTTVWETNVMRDCDEKPPNVPEGDIERCKQSGFRYEDAEFIVHARTDVPALVAEVDRLRAQVARVEALVVDFDAPGWMVDVDELRLVLREES